MEGYQFDEEEGLRFLAKELIDKLGFKSDPNHIDLLVKMIKKFEKKVIKKQK